MPTLNTDDGVKLHHEEAGSGTPIVFVHEFAGDTDRRWTRGETTAWTIDEPPAQSSSSAHDPKIEDQKQNQEPSEPPRGT